MSDPYVYPGTNTLINHFNVKDQNKLQELESAFFRKAMDEPFPEGQFDYNHLKAIHSHLFSSLYPWAGQERTVDIAKANSFFAHAQYISKELNKLFLKLEKDSHLKNMDKDKFCEKLAHYFNEINAAHPFREGNGRTQRAFCKALAHQAGYELDWKKVDREQYINASIDGFKGDDLSMTETLKQIVSPLKKEHEINLSSEDNRLSKKTLTELMKHQQTLKEFDKLYQARKKASGYHAEKINTALISKASEILKNKQLSLEIKSRFPKMFKSIYSVHKEQSHGISR